MILYVLFIEVSLLVVESFKYLLAASLGHSTKTQAQRFVWNRFSSSVVRIASVVENLHTSIQACAKSHHESLPS